MHFYMHSYLYKSFYSCKKWVLHHARRDKAAMARGSTTTDSDRRRRPLCHEHGHRLVTSLVAGRGGTGHRLAWSKPVLGCALWARPSKRIFQYSKLDQTCKCKSSAFPNSKIIKTLHEASLEHVEQVFQLGQFQIRNGSHTIKYGTDSSLNYL
jgi:hypothetical protein